LQVLVEMDIKSKTWFLAAVMGVGAMLAMMLSEYNPKINWKTFITPTYKAPTNRVQTDLSNG
jgi:hypothetical protein